MRGIRAGFVLIAAVLSGPVQAGPDDYVFEFRLLNDDGREIVATCRGPAPCVLDEGPLWRSVNFAVRVATTPTGITVVVSGNGATFSLRRVTADGHAGNQPPSRLPWLLVPELPAVLSVRRYEEYDDGFRCLLCPRLRRLVGSGYLMIRPLPPAPSTSNAR